MKKEKIKETFKFPDETVITFNWNDEQMSDFQGKLNPDLLKKLKEHSDKNTRWNGF